MNPILTQELARREETERIRSVDLLRRIRESGRRTPSPATPRDPRRHTLRAA